MSALPNMPQSLDYILIEQEVAHIEQYCLNATGQWILSDVIGLQARLQLSSVDCALPLTDVYDLVAFPDETTNETHND